LQSRLAEIAIGPEDMRAEFHVVPNRLADYKTVIHVMADAQRLGVTKMAILGHEQFLAP
ncbi:MAG: biopolymer transporter ExbD, partial [Acetobacter peroxydans]|nr:biopolymer transporter ExbD [Acetobacter peroxydans]